MSKAHLTTLTLCSLQQWAHAQMNRAFAVMEQYVNTGFYPRVFPVFASAAGPRALRSWVARVEQLSDYLDITSKEILLRSFINYRNAK